MTDQTASEQPKPETTNSEEFVRAALKTLGKILEAIPPAALETIGRLGEMARDPELQAALMQDLKSAAATIRNEIEQYEADPRSFLYDEMVAGPAVSLISKVRSSDEQVLIDGLDTALRDHAFIATVQEQLGSAPHLSTAQRKRLSAGFAYLDEGDWTLACDLLLKGAEGVLWDTASALGVIDKDQRLVASPRGRKATSPNALVGEDGLPDLPPTFARYLARLLFDHRGHDLRHARDGRDERAHALFAAAAILGWLDHYAEADFMDQVGHRLSDYASAAESAAMSS